MDQVRCDCGNEEIRLDGAVTTLAPVPDPNNGTCRRFCGWKGRPITTAAPTADECRECRRHTIWEGTLSCTCGRRWPILDGIPAFSTRRVEEKTARRYRAIETNPRTDPRWEPFVCAHERALPFHHPGWLRALEEEYGQTRLHLAAEDWEGRLLAVLPLFYTRGLPFNLGGNVTTRRLCSLPRTPAAGVLSVDDEATTLLLESAMNAAQDSQARIQIKTLQPGLDQRAPGLVATEWRPTYITALPEDPERIAFGNSATRHRLKWAVNKAVKLGLEVREAETEAELRAWYPLYLEVMRQNAVPPRPYRFFRAIWELLRRDGVFRLLLAERNLAGRRTLLAGSIILTLGSNACYAFTGGRKEDFVFHPNDLIQWQAIHDACRRGARHYDFGEVAEEHQRLVNFKSKWGAEPAPQFRYYCPAPPAASASARECVGRFRQFTAAVWRQAPLGLTREFGDRIYSYL